MKFLRKESIMCFRTKVSLLLLALFIGAGVFSMSVQPAEAASLAELQQIIEQLKTQIAELQKRLTAVQQGKEDPGEWCHTFNKNLRIGDKGVEVSALRTALATEGFSGLEAMGGAYEFDERLASAVVWFQEKYAKEVLSQWGLKHGTGFVGKSTRAKLNKLYGCGITPVLPVEKCTDSDGGKDYYVKGTVKGINSEGADSGGTDCCAVLTPENSRPSCSKFVTGKDEGNSVWEYVCKTNGEVIGHLYSCPTGYTCKEGACVKQGKSIIVLSPNGGEKWVAGEATVGEAYDIIWDSQGLYGVSIVLRDYSKTADRDYLIAGPSISAESGKYTWTIYEDIIQTGDKYKIIISDGKGATIQNPLAGIGPSDESDDYFSIVAAGTQTCTDTDRGIYKYAKGTACRPSTVNDSMFCRTDRCIPLPDGDYSGTGMRRYLTEYYCKDDKMFSKTIYCENGCANGACERDQEQCAKEGEQVNRNPLMGPTDMQCCEGLVENRVSKSYSICEKPEPSITVISPNGGEKWAIGSTHTIRWTSDTESSRVVIDILNEQGKCAGSEDGLPAVVANNEAIEWTIPTTFSFGQYKMRVMICPVSMPSQECANIDLKQYGFDESDDYFSIVETGTQTCTDTDGGKDYYTKGTTKLNGQEKVDVCRYSYMDSEHTIAYDCVIEYFCQSSNLIGEEKHYCPYGCSNGACKPGITVLSPNGGEKFVIGELYMITWDSRGLDNVTIEIGGYDENNNPIRQWHIISDNFYFVGTKGFVDWIVPSDIKEKFQIAPVKYKIRVRNVGLPILVSDKSDDYFSIVAAGTQTCTDTDGGKNYYVKGTLTFTTTEAGTGGIGTQDDVCIDGSVMAEYGSVLAEYYCEGSDVEVVNYTCPNGCEDGACKGEQPASITVLSPNGGEKWEIGEAYDITWDSQGLDGVNIVLCDYSKTVDRNYLIAGLSIPAESGKYTWTINKDVIQTGDKYKIMVVDSRGTTVQNPLAGIGPTDASDDYFSIVAPELSDCHTPPLWDWDYCSTDCKCNVNEGDCDTDADCAEGLFCAKNVGANYGQDSRIDVCQKAQNITY